jgi:hypothetical protein
MTAFPPLPRIPYLRLRCTLRAEQPARLPPYKGSTLRGGFGHALRRTVCVMGPAQPCETCLVRRTCVHTRLFETFLETEPPPFLRGLPTAPRPYVFEPLTDACALAPGDPLAFDLLLFGQATDLLGYALLAVERMAAAGLGRGRARFSLHRAHVLTADGAWTPLAEAGRLLPAAAPPRPLLPPLDPPAGTTAVLHFLTPTRLKIRERIAPAVSFRELVFLMLRRTLEIAAVHLPGAAVDWSFRPYLEHASTVRATPALHWHDWERYSNRQNAAMTLGGFLGTLTLEGDLTPFGPLLRTAEILHVGKGATFGLGKLSIDSPPESLPSAMP